MSQFKVSALKYRPQRFEDVVGQKHVTDTLKNALNKDQLAHALLFCGPRGVGKTTCARILAKALNCENPDDDHEPCNECNSCRALNKNASFNITELDAASNNSVDDIRSLVEQTRILPQAGNYSVFIIDEVHMLSSAAFNAFLKTLEEPPSHVFFILATTEKHKIIPTILSRCQIYDFKRIQVKDISQHLANIAQKEGVDADSDALNMIALKADGALRDALSIFDRIVSAVGGKITYDDVIDQLHILDYDYFFKMTDALIAEDVPTVYQIFDEIIQYGFQPDNFIVGLGNHLRDLLVCQYKDAWNILEYSEGLKEKYISQANVIDKSFLLRCLHIINVCDTRYQRARNKRLHVELALNHMCFSSRYSEKIISDGTIVKKKQPKQVAASDTDASIEKPTPGTVVEEPIIQENIPADKSTQDEIVKASANVDKSNKSDEKTSSHATTENKVSRKRSSSIPSLGSLDDLRSRADKERKKRQSNRVDLTQENLEKYVDDWLQEQTSTFAVTAVKNSQFLLQENNQIKVLLGSRTDGTIIKNESGLVAALRNFFILPDINLTYEISQELLEKRNADKPLSPRESLEKLTKENPKIKELQQKLGLEIKE